MKAGLVRFVVILGCLAARSGADGAAPSAPRLSTPIFGPEELVMTKADRDARGLTYWPDGNISLLPAGPNTHRFFAANGGLIGVATGSLEIPAALSARPEIAIQGMKHVYNYAAGGSIWKDSATGTLLMVYHAEIWPTGNPFPFYSVLGMAKSTDDGGSWFDLGEIVRHNQPMAAATDGAEIGGGPLVVNGDHFYVYFRDVQPSTSYPPGIYNDVAVARARVQDVLDAAQRGDVVPWAKYYSGQWSEAGLGGRSTNLEPGTPSCAWSDVTYNEYARKYLLACDHWISLTHTRLEYAESSDGLNWSPRVFVADKGPGTEMIYASFVSGGRDPRRTGENLFLYYVAAPVGGFRWDEARLLRRRVTLPGVHVDAISPVTGPTLGGAQVTVFGKGFAAGATLALGGTLATNVTVHSPTTLTATTGPHARGTVDVTVAVPGGDSDTAPKLFFYDPPPTPTRFFTLPPCRLIDTRDPSLAQSQPLLTPVSSRTYATGSRCGIPTTATALSVNITITQPRAPGFVTLYPGDGLSASSSLNFLPGQTRANNSIVGIAPDGALGVRNGSDGTAHLIVDVNGYSQ